VREEDEAVVQAVARILQAPFPSSREDALRLLAVARAADSATQLLIASAVTGARVTRQRPVHWTYALEQALLAVAGTQVERQTLRRL
jgi:hypothetical protein